MFSRVQLAGLCIVTSLFAQSIAAMGLRSFVALPVDKGGKVVRMQVVSNTDTDTDVMIANGAYGIDGKQTALLGISRRLSSGKGSRTGDLSALYRRIVWQDDSVTGTRRLGLLGGIIVPTEKDREAAVQVGIVSTIFKGRTEWDLDVLYRAGLDGRPDSGQYDVSFQYRLSPTAYPEWGIATEWHGVVELNGRWQEGNKITHQVTLGLQWIQPRWLLEGGLVQDLNSPDDTRLLLSTRFHF